MIEDTPRYPDIVLVEYVEDHRYYNLFGQIVEKMYIAGYTTPVLAFIDECLNYYDSEYFTNVGLLNIFKKWVTINEIG